MKLPVAKIDRGDVTVAEVGGVSVVIGIVASCLYFCYHAPGALEMSLKKVYKFSAADVSFMFTVYSIPNLVMPLFAGIAIDKYGLKRVAMLLLLFMVVGSIIFALAPSIASSNTAILTIMLIGRFVQGLGGESLVTFQQTACNFWFAGVHESKSLGTALAVQQALGSAGAFNLLETHRDKWGLSSANWFVVGFCLFSLAMLFLYAFLEWRFMEYLLNTQRRKVQLFPKLICFGFQPKECSPANLSHVENTHVAEEKQVGMMESIYMFDRMFWVENIFIFLNITILYTSANFFPFFLEEKFGMSELVAGHCTSLLYWACSLSPLAGALTDHIGQRLWVQAIATFGATLGYIFLSCTHISPWLMMFWIGLCFSFLEQNSYSILARNFECMAMKVEGTGYGIMGIFLNLGLIIVPLLVGWLEQATHSHQAQNLLYIIFLVLGLILSVMMLKLDTSGVFNMTTAEATEYIKSLKAAGTGQHGEVSALLGDTRGNSVTHMKQARKKTFAERLWERVI